MNDDFNSPVAIASLFEAVRIINSVKEGHSQINAEELEQLKSFIVVLFSIFWGLFLRRPETTTNWLTD